nr:GNAT family N-acetyltransferase [Thermococcus sp. GR6]
MFHSAYFTLPDEEEEFYEDLKKNKDKAPTFAVIENESERLIGIAGFNWINWQARWGEILYYLAPEERSKGYGSETVKVLCEYAFRHLNLHKVGRRFTQTTFPQSGFWRRTASRWLAG